jgi:hypothetical protein
MAEILGKELTDQSAGCVNCHAVAVEAGVPKHPTFDLTDGVTCAVCHGSYKEWVDKHGGLESDEWRQLSRTAKEEKFGMTDLWDAAKRTTVCASCHIGNADEGKFVTHEMYAAGHPPLPGFELATFGDSMPRHWELLREKTPAVQKILHYDASKLEQVELVLVSAAASFREAMNLLAAQAKQCMEGGQSQPRLLDFANFDCYSCHHDLKAPSWRAKRGYQAPPGRPMPRPWPTALITVAVRHATEDAQAGAELKKFDDHLHKVTQAFGARPFGDPQSVAIATTEASDWANQLVKSLQDATYTQADAKQILGDLTKVSDLEQLDYDSARQIAWAFTRIYSELEPKPASHREIAQRTERLELQLNLNLPSGQDREILKELPKALETIADYDPDVFRTTMDELGKLLD